ncbi:MAG: ABC transporter ATP-binding protein [Lachnospiraceae bacterium]|nr:ABC transporter ATP-binding protein [Lachnospiraceae bacterium]
MSLIELKNISRAYTVGDREFYAIHDINMNLEEGELVVILGPSGAGKSTLLNILGGMDSPTEGEFFFDGRDIARFKDKDLTDYRAWNVGVVFQFYNLIPTLTAYENVALMKDVRANSGKRSVWNKGDVEVMAPENAIAAVGLSERMDHFPSQLSGGEQQRISIARAIAKNPRLLLCDEPTGALDTNTGREVLKLLQDISHKEGRTVVMVTHNSSCAEIADRVIRVKNATVVSDERIESPKDALEVNW